MCCGCSVCVKIRRRAFAEAQSGTGPVQWTALGLSLDVGCISKGRQRGQDSWRSLKCKQWAGLHIQQGIVLCSINSSAHTLGPLWASLLAASLIAHESFAGRIVPCMGRCQTRRCQLSFMICCRQKPTGEILIVNSVCSSCWRQSFLSSEVCYCKVKSAIRSVQCTSSPCSPAYSLIHWTASSAGLPWIDRCLTSQKIPLNYYKVIYPILVY